MKDNQDTFLSLSRGPRLLSAAFALTFSALALFTLVVPAQENSPELSLSTTLSHINPSALSPNNQLHYTACLNRDNTACYNLANSLHGGIGAPREDTIALSLISYTCDNGLSLGCLELGTRLYLGDGINQDLNRARWAFDRACDQRLERGCYMTGYLYFEGEGVLRDPQTAASYFSLACEMGMPQACNLLPNLQ